jgi:ABC-2 type transport system ATP-binding protein
MVRTTDPLAIDLDHVAKTYRRKVHALRGIRLEVHPGEIFGLLGPNGAGKSTLVKIMMTVVRPTRAEGTVLGRPMGHKPTLAKVGYLPEHHRFPPYLTGAQALEYYGALAKVDRRTRKRRTAELLELVGLKDKAKTKVGTYSKGMQQRIGLAQALMHEPELVVLDEPTDGLDPMGRRQVRQSLAQLRDEGKTVFINSHLLGEVELVCDRVAILNAGKVVRQGTIDELTAGNMFHEIELDGPPNDILREAVAAALSGKVTVEVENNVIRINTRDPMAVQPVIDSIRRQSATILSVRPVRQSLEDFFISAVSEPVVDEPVVASIVKGDRS